MDFLDTLNIAASGLTAQRVRLQTVASNMANVRTTRGPDGQPYQRQAPVFRSERVASFGDSLDRALAEVEIEEIHSSEGAGVRVYDPGHPDADGEGYVTFPDINVLHEMVDMMNANRSYEANIKSIDTTFEMARNAMEIGR